MDKVISLMTDRKVLSSPPEIKTATVQVIIHEEQAVSGTKTIESDIQDIVRTPHTRVRKCANPVILCTPTTLLAARAQTHCAWVHCVQTYVPLKFFAKALDRIETFAKCADTEHLQKIHAVKLETLQKTAENQVAIEQVKKMHEEVLAKCNELLARRGLRDRDGEENDEERAGWSARNDELNFASVVVRGFGEMVMQLEELEAASTEDEDGTDAAATDHAIHTEAATMVRDAMPSFPGFNGRAGYNLPR